MPGGTSLYVLHADGRVRSNFFPAPDHPDRWSGWFALPGEQRFPAGSTITTLSTAAGGTSLYVQSGDGKVSTNFFPAANGALQWNDWFALGDKTFPPHSTVTALSTRPGGTSLYVLGSDSKVWTNFFPAANGAPQWNGWFALGDAVFPPGATVSALSTTPGGTSLFVRDDQYVVWTNVFPGAAHGSDWSGWWPLAFPPYISWLPATPGLRPVAFTRSNPQRTQ